jgi:hypothetical protein
VKEEINIGDPRITDCKSHDIGRKNVEYQTQNSVKPKKLTISNGYRGGWAREGEVEYIRRGSDLLGVM